VMVVRFFSGLVVMTFPAVVVMAARQHGAARHQQYNYCFFHF
jgi:hypothetical protein